MPLVVPGLTSKDGGDKNSQWMNNLMGKKIGETSNETVRCLTSQQTSLRIIIVVASGRPDREQLLTSDLDVDICKE